MADQDDAEAALAQPLDEVQDLRGLLDAEGGGRFVEDDDPGVADQGAGDGDHLALAAGEGGDRDPHARDADRQGVQEFLGAPLHGDLVQGAAAAQLAAEEEVGDDVEVVAEREVLVDGRDAEGLGVLGAADPDRAALPGDGALVDGVDPGDRLDQRGLSGTVVADQGDDLTGVDVEVDVGECLDSAEALGDRAQRQYGCACHVNHLLRGCAVSYTHL